MLGDLLADLWIALRSLRREPGFVLLAVLSLGVGVGSTATVFGMVDQLLFRPLPGVADPDRAAYVEMQGHSRMSGRDFAPFVTTRDFDEIRGATDLLAGIGAYGLAGIPQVSTGNGPAVRVEMEDVYGDYFGVLGVHPAEGRLLRAEESLGNPRIAIISEELRAKLFGHASSAVGRTIQVDGKSVTVVGVAGGGFQGVDRRISVQMWLPYSALTVFNGFGLGDLKNNAPLGTMVVRLRPGVDPEAAQAQMRSAIKGIVQANPEEAPRLADVRPVLRPGFPYSPRRLGLVYGELEPFAVVVLLVLLVACANVGTLLLMRNLTRRGLVATRRALGASPGRIARHHFAESALLAGLGSAVGLLAAWLIAVPFAGQSVGRGMPAFAGFHMDVRVLTFAVAASAVTLVVFGAIPATLAGRFDLSGALRAGEGSDTQGMAGLRRLMSAGQIAVCVTLLTGAALLVRTIRNLYALDTGISVDGVATADLGMPAGLGAPSALADVYRNLIASVRSVPGVESAAMDMGGPLAGRSGVDLALPNAPDRTISAVVRPVTPGWFEVVRLHMERGVPFRDGDWQPGSTPVPMVITSALAYRVFGSTNPIGRALLVRLSPDAAQEARVVGVSRDIRLPNHPDEPLDAFFVPLSSFPFKAVTLVVRAQSLDRQMGTGIRQAVQRVVPDMAPPALIPLAVQMGTAFADQRTLGHLLELLSTLAMILASVGLYGVIGFSVAQRRREFGIRMALGAEGSHIARLVLGDAAAIVAVGTTAGLVGAYMLSILLANRLYGVAQADPISYVTASVLFALVAAAACWMPTRTAMRADPVETLRNT